MFEENIKKIIEKKFSSSNFILNNKYFEIHIESGKIFDLIKELKENSNLKFDQLIDLTAIDYPSKEKRFDGF